MTDKVQSKVCKSETQETYQKQKQPKSDVQEKEPSDIEGSDTDTSEETLPLIHLVTGKKVAEKETVTPSPSRSSKKKGKKTPSGRKVEKKVELQRTTGSPLADVEVIQEPVASRKAGTSSSAPKGKTELAGKKQPRKRPSAISTEEKTTKKRIKLSAEERNVQEPVASTASAAPQAKEERRVVQRKEKNVGQVGTTATPKTCPRRSTRGRRVPATSSLSEPSTSQPQAKKERHVAQRKKKNVGRVRTTGTPKTRPRSSTRGRHVPSTSALSEATTATLQAKKERHAVPKMQKNVGQVRTTGTPKTRPRRSTHGTRVPSTSALSEATTVELKDLKGEGAAAEATGGEISALQLPQQKTEPAEQEHVDERDDSDVSNQDVAAEGASAEAAGEAEISALQLALEETKSTEHHDDSDISKQTVDAKGDSVEAGNFRTMKLPWEDTDPEEQDDVVHPDDSDVSNQDVEAEGDTVEVGNFRTLKLPWEESEQDATVHHDDSDKSNQDVEAQEESSEASAEAERISALRLLWEQTEDSDLEDHDDTDTSNQPVQPTSGREAVSGDDLPLSTFIAQLEAISLMKIKCTSLYMGEEIPPVYFGDFSISEVLASYDPNDVPLEDPNDREPGPQHARPGTRSDSASTDTKQSDLTAEELNFAVLTLSDLTLQDLTPVDPSPTVANPIASFASRGETAHGRQEPAAPPAWMAAARVLFEQPRPRPARRYTM